MGFFSFLGFGNNKLRTALRNGAVVIDVRTAQEFDSGRYPGAINIPIDRISTNLSRIRAMEKPVICCCSSGARSSQAVALLKKQGIKAVYNGGKWTALLALSRN